MSPRASRNALRRGIVFFAVALLAPAARGQSRPGFAVGRYEPSERGSEWFVVDGLDMRGRARPALGVTLDYAHKPLVVYDSAQSERLALVRHQLFVHPGASVVVAEAFRFGADAPVAIYQDGEAAVVGGESLTAATAPALGDVRLAFDARVAGRYGAPISVALGVRGWLPTGVRAQLTSDGSVRVAPQVLVGGELGVFVWAARAAITYRPRDDPYAGTPVGSEVSVAVGAGARVGRVLVGPEIFGSTGLAGDAFLRAHGTPADAVVGVHYCLPSGLRMSAALGSGLTRGYGSPAFRALASVEWGAPIPVAPPDRDGDGIPNALDACPEQPGVASGDPELNGCPTPERVPDEDTDHDGVWDRDDACPVLEGVPTPDPMTNGCPPDAPRPLAVATGTEIRIAEQIQFATGSAELLAENDAVLSAVQHILDEHPDIRRVRVEGHTDDTGDPTHNDDLSRRRAAAVVRWLVDHGVDPGRLSSEGFGSRRPVDTNLTEEGRANNRRVAFSILEREPRR